MTYKIGTLVIGLTAMLFTSCLSDGDDTMVLEKGEKNEFVDGDQTVVVGTNEYADIENGGFTLYVPRVPCQRPTLATTDEWLSPSATLTYPTFPASCLQGPV